MQLTILFSIFQWELWGITAIFRQDPDLEDDLLAQNVGFCALV